MKTDGNPMKTIFLIGFMGVGKSAVADCLNREYGMRRIEMDEAIEQKEQMSISELFARKGEPYFRQLETDLIASLESADNTVVSCGGGVAMRKENVELMRRIGRVVLLTATPETILSRVTENDDRPLLRGKKNVRDIAALMEARRPAYEAAADLTVAVDGKTPQEICGEILK